MPKSTPVAAAKSGKPARHRRPRRTNAERSSEMRRKLFDASISCLHEHGYSATTTAMVAERAGVSRGAMAHHFSTKTELMVAVVEDVFERDLQFYRTHLEPEAVRDHMARLIDLAWKAISGEGGQAVLHIMLAMQGDPELRSRLPPVIERMSTYGRELIRAMARATGLKNRAMIDASVTLHLAALRGLAIEAIIGTDRRSIQGALKLLHTYLAHLQNILAAGEH
ncbi:TetR/AcrR family transcriptional regulator [Solimonas terrae]